MDTLKKSPVSSPWIEDVNIDELDIDVSGTLLTQDPDTGFPDFLIINAAYGSGKPVANGIVCPDEYRVFKPFIDEKCHDAIVGRTLGAKELREVLVNDSEKTIHEESTPIDEQHHFALLPEQIMQLAQLAKEIERVREAFGDRMDSRQNLRQISFSEDHRPCTHGTEQGGVHRYLRTRQLPPGNLQTVIGLDEVRAILVNPFKGTKTLPIP